MTIWIDGDACPVVIKNIIFRAAERTGIAVKIVANQYMKLPKLPSLEFIKVEAGFDMADTEIVRLIKKNDLVITADIPLAAEILKKAAMALNPRGELYTIENIGLLLNMRDFMDTLRSSGVTTGGPDPMVQKHRKAFADNFDKIISKYLKKK